MYSNVAFSESEQNEYIKSQLIKQKTCEIPEIKKAASKIFEKGLNMSSIQENRIKSALTEKYASSTELKMVLCTMDAIFLTTSQSNIDNIRILSPAIKKFINSIKTIGTGAVGLASDTGLFDNDTHVVLKSLGPKTDPDEFSTFIREYFIGISTINKLRDKIPTFVYTLGIFLCRSGRGMTNFCSGKGPSIPYMVLEKIPGKSILSLMPKIEFKHFLLIFYQLLISLELAQRACGFTHYDLHYENVLIRNDDQVKSYEILLDTKEITIQPGEFLPVIIDFGLSTIKYDNHFIGPYGYTKHGIIRKTLPGFDMYKFLTFCGSRSTGITTSRIKELFDFFGSSDPYNISNSTGKKQFEICVREYCRKITHSNLVQRTPIEMIEWIEKKYSEILDPYIEIKPRRSAYIISKGDINALMEYNIFSIAKRRMIKCFSQMIDISASHLYTKANIDMLELFNVENTDYFQTYSYLLGSYNDQLTIEFDNILLSSLYDIDFPTRQEIISACKIIENTSLRDKYNVDYIKNALHTLKFFKRLEPYLNMYYLILQTDLQSEKIYKNWINFFIKSEIFELYLEFRLRILKVLRWSKNFI